MQTTRYYVEDSGRVYRQTVNDQEMDLSTDIMSKFTGEITVRMRNIFHSAVVNSKLVGNIHGAMRGKQVVFTAQLSVLPLRARFKVMEDYLVPDFTAESTPMALEWKPPADMRLFLLIGMLPDMWKSAEQFLVAVDDSNRTYRLPTTNCYDNCKLCAGRFDGTGSSYADCMGKATLQFFTSEWQSDLSDRGGAKGMENSKRMFRFKPLAPEGFEQLPPNATHWTDLCTKVGDAYITNFLTL